MTVEKPKPKQLLRPITSGAGSAMNQSQFLTITCGIYNVSWNIVIYACALPEPLNSRFSAILKSFCPSCSTH